MDIDRFTEISMLGYSIVDLLYARVYAAVLDKIHPRNAASPLRGRQIALLTSTFAYHFHACCKCKSLVDNLSILYHAQHMRHDT